MQPEEVMDTLAHEFLLVTIKRQLDDCNDLETLRKACLQLVDIMEKQKAMFKQIMRDSFGTEEGAPEL